MPPLRGFLVMRHNFKKYFNLILNNFSLAPYSAILFKAILKSWTLRNEYFDNSVIVIKYFCNIWEIFPFPYIAIFRFQCTVGFQYKLFRRDCHMMMMMVMRMIMRIMMITRRRRRMLVTAFAFAALTLMFPTLFQHWDGLSRRRVMTHCQN